MYVCNTLFIIFIAGITSVSTRPPPNPIKKPEQETGPPQRSFSTTSTTSVGSTGSSATDSLPPSHISHPISESGEESSVQPNSSVPSSTNPFSSTSTQASESVVSQPQHSKEETDEVVFDQRLKPVERQEDKSDQHEEAG